MPKSTLWTKPFLIIMAVNFMMYLSVNMLSPTLPIHLMDLGFSNTITGLCLGVFTIGSLIVRPLAGGVLDQWGRRIVFLVSVIILASLFFGYSLATTLMPILLLRLLHGLDWGFASTSTSTMATDIIPRHMIGRGMGIFGLSMSIALAFAPTVGLAVINRFGFDSMIHLCTLFFAASLLLSFFFPFAPVEKKQRKLNKSDLFERSAILPAIIMGCITLSMAAITSYVPLYAIELGITNMGLYFTVYALGLVAVRTLVGIILDRWGLLAATIPSFVCVLIALVCLGFAQNYFMILASGFFYGIGYGGTQTTMQSLAVMKVPRERYGAANGTFFIGFDLGVGLGALLAGTLSDWLGYSTMYLSLTVFVLIAMVLVIKAAPRKTNAK